MNDLSFTVVSPTKEQWTFQPVAASKPEDFMRWGLTNDLPVTALLPLIVKAIASHPEPLAKGEKCRSNNAAGWQVILTGL